MLIRTDKIDIALQFSAVSGILFTSMKLADLILGS
jgi:hypothetical protein